MQQYSRILIIKLGSLGDVVQVEGVIHDIRLHHPDATLIALTTPPYRNFFERCPWIDEVVLDPRAPRWNLVRMVSFRARLRGLGLDMVYDLQQVRRTHFYYRWFLRDVDWLGRAPGCRYHFSLVPNRSALDQFSAQLSASGVPNGHSLRADLGWMAEDMESYLEKAGVFSPFVVLIPGASSGQTHKRWPYYDELGSWLKKQGIQAVTIPGPSEMELCGSLKNVQMLVAENGTYLDFFELAGILQKAAFVVGNDTGPVHIAANLGCPGLALYSGGWPPTMTGIQHSRFNWIEVDDLGDLSVETVAKEVTAHFLSGYTFPAGDIVQE